MRALRRWLTPPIFPDDTRTQQAFLLHTILWVLMLVPVPYVLYSLAATPQSAGRALIQGMVGEAANIFLLILLRRGRVRLAASLQVAAFWLFFTLTAITGAGVRGEAYLLGYCLVITIAGLLLGGRGSLATTALSLLAGGAMVFAEAGGRLVPNISDTALTAWVVTLVLFPLSAMLQYLGARVVRQALDRARASETQYRFLFEALPEGIVISDEQPRILLANPAAAGILGYAPEELVGLDPLHLIDPDDLARQPFSRSRLLRGETLRLELLLLRRDGTRVPVALSLRRLPDGRFQHLFQDITVRRQAEAERERLIAELEMRNAELERYAYTLSHELRAPLVTLRAFVGYLDQHLQHGRAEQARADMARIVRATDSMHILIRDLLELSRIGRLMNPPESVPFGDLVREARELAQGRLEARGVQVDLAPGLPAVYGDRVRLVEVLHNLLDNAAKFMGGQLQPRVEIGQQGTGDGGLPVFFVRDNGIGIEPAYHSTVFGLFNKLDARSEGTGVGLALAKRIVEVHGGRIWLESAPGQGTCVLFSLPAAPAAGPTHEN